MDQLWNQFIFYVTLEEFNCVCTTTLVAMKQSSNSLYYVPGTSTSGLMN